MEHSNFRVHHTEGLKVPLGVLVSLLVPYCKKYKDQTIIVLQDCAEGAAERFSRLTHS